MTAEFHRVPPREGYYLFWENTPTRGFTEPTIGQYISYPEDQNPYTPYFQVAGSEMDFRPEKGMKQDWFYGPLDIEVPELPNIPS